MTDCNVISWDISESVLSDGSPVFDVIGTSDECRVRFNCVSEAGAEALIAALDCCTGATAEAITHVDPARASTQQGRERVHQARHRLHRALLQLTAVCVAMDSDHDAERPSEERYQASIAEALNLLAVG